MEFTPAEQKLIQRAKKTNHQTKFWPLFFLVGLASIIFALYMAFAEKCPQPLLIVVLIVVPIELFYRAQLSSANSLIKKLTADKTQ